MQSNKNSSLSNDSLDEKKLAHIAQASLILSPEELANALAVDYHQSIEERYQKIRANILSYNECTKGVLPELDPDIFLTTEATACRMFGAEIKIREEQEEQKEQTSALKK